MDEVIAFSGFLGGLLAGAGAALALTHLGNPYGHWLGRHCWVRPIGRAEWREHVIVAVSWRGAVCVRRADALSEEGYWIKKQNVRHRVRFAPVK